MKKKKSPKRRAVIVGTAALAAAAAAGLVLFLLLRAGGARENLLVNPGFEEGDRGWTWLRWSAGWAPFQVSGARAFEGRSAAHLPVRSAGDGRATIVWGVVQEVTLAAGMPECLAGRYLVDTWKRGARNQYVQAVIIDLSRKAEGGNAQVRYLLSGMATQPYNLSNARYAFLDPERKTTPKEGTWVPFRADPAADFRKGWGYVPAAGTKLRVLFEARFDGRKQGDPEAVADVFYDGLYFGPAGKGGCR